MAFVYEYLKVGHLVKINNRNCILNQSHAE